MPKRCRQSKILAGVSLASWTVALFIMVAPRPAAGDLLERVFFAALGIALCTGTLVTLPWMMREYVQDQVLAYVAGFMHSQADEQDARPPLSVVR